jgi:hypothetical protein
METKQTSSRSIGTRLELVAAVTLGLLSVGVFIAQPFVASSATTRIETVLFNCLQFLLTIGFTWFSTRAVSRIEFEQSIKRYAISAYRRIADIERLVGKLHTEVRTMIRSDPSNSNLVVVEAMVSDSEQVIKSSIADWADVIGEELLALEKIKRLEREKVELKEEAPQETHEIDYEVALKSLNDEIAKLKSMLPARLQFVTDSTQDFIVADEHATDWMARQHRRERGLKLVVVTGDEYEHDREFSTIKVGELLHTIKKKPGRFDVFDVADENGKILGRLTNNSPMDYGDFIQTLENCYGSPSIRLKVVKILGSDTRHAKFWAWFRVQVISPLVETDKLTKQV